MNFRSIHEVRPCGWKEIASYEIRSNKVGGCSCSPISEIHIREPSIITRLCITPSIPRCRTRECTLCLEIRIDRSPSCRIIVFQSETIPVLILLRHWNTRLECHSIESPLEKDSIIHSSSCDIFPILIDSSRFIDQIECTIDRHTESALWRHIDNTLRSVSCDDRDRDGSLRTIALQGEVISELESIGIYLSRILAR